MTPWWLCPETTSAWSCTSCSTTSSPSTSRMNLSSSPWRSWPMAMVGHVGPQPQLLAPSGQLRALSWSLPLSISVLFSAPRAPFLSCLIFRWHSFFHVHVSFSAVKILSVFLPLMLVSIPLLFHLLQTTLFPRFLSGSILVISLSQEAGCLFIPEHFSLVPSAFILQTGTECLLHAGAVVGAWPCARSLPS